MTGVSEQLPTARADGLRDLLAVVNSSRGVDEILAYVVQKTEEVLGADGAAVYLLDPHDPTLMRRQARHGIPARLLSDARQLGSPVTGQAVARVTSR